MFSHIGKADRLKKAILWDAVKDKDRTFLQYFEEVYGIETNDLTVPQLLDAALNVELSNQYK